MPRLPADFDDTEPGTIGNYTIGLGDNVPTGVAILNAPWTLSIRYVAPGYDIDPSPGDRAIGSPTISGTDVIQRIGNLYSGNTYLVVVTATMDDGEIVILWCTLTCVAPS